ncbi:NUDIX hydrolase [bacterium]|nr:NUDIX hydrolase [bacterium]
MKKISETVVHRGTWISCLETIFEDNGGNRHTWESIRRNTGSDTVVVVIARLAAANKYVFIKQFRPAVDNYVIGFPAGICENGDIEETALAELKEETGFSGRVTAVSPVLRTSPAAMSDNLYLVYADIDEGAPENRDPQQQLEPAEDIEPIIKSKREMYDFITGGDAAGLDISAGIWYFLM